MMTINAKHNFYEEACEESDFAGDFRWVKVQKQKLFALFRWVKCTSAKNAN